MSGGEGRATIRELQIKALTRQLVKQAGGYDAAASLVRFSRAHLHRCGSIAHKDTYLPADALAELIDDTGSIDIIRFLADLAGYDLVARDDGAGSSDALCVKLAAARHALQQINGGSGKSEAVRDEIHETMQEALAALTRVQTGGK